MTGEIRRQIRGLFERFATLDTQGMVELPIEGVGLFWTREFIPREPLVYEPGIIILGQGHKTGYLADREFTYDEETCLVVGAPIPFECESHATKQEPLVGVRLEVDLSRIHRIVTRCEEELVQGQAPLDRELHSAVEPMQIDARLRGAIVRLLECIADPLDVAVLGEGRYDEVLYRILQSDRGHVLDGLTRHHTQYASIASALVKIHRDYRQSFNVDELARQSAMSTSSFHRAFKKVTGNSPIQYLKRIRLNKARGLLLHHDMQVNRAAYEVGYESPSQFSREFKRLFAISPSDV